MKMVVIYSFDSKDKAVLKAAQLEEGGFRLDIFEDDVTSATCDFSANGGGQCAAGDGSWIVAGTKNV